MRIKNKHFIQTSKTKGLMIFEIDDMTPSDILHIVIRKMKDIKIK